MKMVPDLPKLALFKKANDLVVKSAEMSVYSHQVGILSPTHEIRDLMSVVESNTLELQDRVSCDRVSSVSEMGRIEAVIRSGSIGLIKGGLVPFFLYKHVDGIMRRKGLSMLIVKKK